MFFKFARNTMSNMSPSSGIAPTLVSMATFSAIRAISHEGAPKRRASQTI